MSRTPLEWKEFYTGSSFSSKYSYSGRLGAWVDESGTHFTLWSPCAQGVKLRLYSHGSKEEDGTDTDEPETVYQMQYGKKGVFSLHSRKNLSGKYYEYEIDHEDGTVITPDPCATACGVNGHRSMVLDLSQTDPDGWAEDRAPAKTAETVICETHVKDFSWDRSGGFADDVRGKFLAFTKKNTYLNGTDHNKKTGVPYLADLGVTHIELMPMYDYGSVDEAASFAKNLKGSKDGEPYNWGYDPVMYNCPEGSYSSDPYRGEVRISELKQAIMALHKAGFRVIMDVVYNHTFSLDSAFQKTVPWYYYRIDEEGNPSDGSGCGNDFASEMPMAHKFIVDSVLYWASEYHIDGFRFDLMGLLDTDLMNDIRRQLDKRFGDDEKILFGEPWCAHETHMANDAHQANKEHIEELAPSIGAFNDKIRDAVKGSVFRASEPGFADGGEDTGNIKEAIVSCLKANRSITYLSCHDNLTLWDKISAVNGLRPLDNFEEKRLRQYRFCASLSLMMPGRPFFLEGEEGCRTKMGDENSYNAPVEENAIDWEYLYRHQSIIDYYRGLIALRKSLPILCRKDENLADDFIVSAGVEDGLAHGLVLVQAKDASGELLFIYNNSPYDRRLSLPSGQWQLLADTDCSTYWQDERPHIEDKKIISASMSTLILKKV